MKAEEPGPYLTLAVFVEDHRTTESNKLDLLGIHGASLVGHHPDRPPNAAFSVEGEKTLFLQFVSGDYEGKLPVVISCPSLGFPDVHLAGEFQGQDIPVSAAVPLKLQPRCEGLHWVAVSLAGKVVTRVPLRIISRLID